VPIGNSGDYEGGWCAAAFASPAVAFHAAASDYKSTGTALATGHTTTKLLVSAKVSALAAFASCPSPPLSRVSCCVHYAQRHRNFLSLRTAHASQHFSSSFPGPAPLNLEIPPYVFMTDTKVKSTVLIDALAAAFSRRKKLTRFQVKIGWVMVRSAWRRKNEFVLRGSGAMHCLRGRVAALLRKRHERDDDDDARDLDVALHFLTKLINVCAHVSAHIMRAYVRA
jgi:hypothetical protein